MDKICLQNLEMIRQKWERLGTFLFYIAVSLETLYVLLDKSDYIIPSETWAFRFTFLLFGLKILTTKYNKREWIAIGGAALLSVISFLATDRDEIARVSVMIIACKDVDLKSILKLVFWETLIGCCVIMGLSVTGVYGEIFREALFRGGSSDTEIRYTLGMGHPNALHCMAWSVSLLGLALYYDRLKDVAYLLIFLAHIMLYIFTDSKSGFMISAITILAFWIGKKRKNITTCRKTYLFGCILMLGIIVFTIIIGTHGEEVWWIKILNRALNGRFQLALWEGGVAKWTLLSTPESYSYFDMGWAKLFYCYGIIPSVIYITLIVLTIHQTYKKSDYAMYTIIVMFMIYTVVEAHAVSSFIGRNYVLFIIGYYWTRVLSGFKAKEQNNE